MDFFKLRNISEANGAGEDGTPELVAKYKNATPGQNTSAPSKQQPARKGDKLKEEIDIPVLEGEEMWAQEAIDSVNESKESIRAELRKIADRMHAIEKSGGRVPLTDPLHQKVKQLRAKLKTMKEDSELEEGYALVHKMSKKVLSTHDDEASAKDEHKGLGKDSSQYKVIKTSKKAKDFSMKEESDQLDELKVSTLTRYGTKATQALGRNPEKDEKRIKGIQSARAKVQQKTMKKEAFEDPEAQKAEMALTKLHFIEYAAEEIMEYIEMGAPIEEWYQIKLAKVHADMEGLHSYMEGEKRRTGMVDEAVKPYVSSTSPKFGEKGSHDVVGKDGKVVKSYPYHKGGMQLAQAHLKKLHKEEVEIDEAAFAPTMKKAIAAHERGDKKMAKYHLDNAKTARYAMKSTEISKHKDMLDKYKEMSKSYMSEGENKQMKGKDPCWKGYQMVGMKKKGDKQVPNCVPANEGVSYKVDVEGLPTMYIASKSPSEVKANLRKLLKKQDSIKSVERVMDTDVRKAFRLKAQGKEEMEEGVMKNIKRAIKGTDAESRAGEEATKMMKAQQAGDNAAATKHNNRYKKLSALTKKEGYKSDAQRKAVWASRNERGVTEKLDPSMGAGEYVKDFEKSDAPQFKGKTKKERQKMAVAAYLAAKRGE